MLFLIDITYKKSLDDVQNVLAEHRQYLREYTINKGILLASGPKSPRTGGVIIAKGEQEDIDKMIQNDPFYIHDVAEYKVTTFDPLNRQECLSQWYASS
ncbi:YciI family protein [Thiotrichales bacterium 19S9-12]|nr:YciI family protein [Thiotrichales bacterium 19S9-11]MCF6812274.1 YciI family protein [Thiotrichales bacterium 19S9-12]